MKRGHGMSYWSLQRRSATVLVRQEQGGHDHYLAGGNFLCILDALALWWTPVSKADYTPVSMATYLRSAMDADCVLDAVLSEHSEQSSNSATSIVQPRATWLQHMSATTTRAEDE